MQPQDHLLLKAKVCRICDSIITLDRYVLVTMYLVSLYKRPHLELQSGFLTPSLHDWVLSFMWTTPNAIPLSSLHQILAIPAPRVRLAHTTVGRHYACWLTYTNNNCESAHLLPQGDEVLYLDLSQTHVQHACLKDLLPYSYLSILWSPSGLLSPAFHITSLPRLPFLHITRLF